MDPFNPNAVSSLPVPLTVNTLPTTLPDVVPDFGWYYGLIPTRPLNGLIPLGILITFDATDHVNIGLNQTVVPQGLSIAAWLWDLGNGTTATGPYPSTTYNFNQPPPGLRASLTVIDSLGREYSCTKYLSFTLIPLSYGSGIKVDSGSART